MADTMVLSTDMSVVNVGQFLIIFWAWNPYFNQVVFLEESSVNIIEKRKKVCTMIKSNYGWYNHFVVAVVDVSKFSLCFLAGNPYFNQAVMCRNLRWILSLKNREKVYLVYYNQVKLWSIQSRSSCQLLMLASFSL